MDVDSNMFICNSSLFGNMLKIHIEAELFGFLVKCAQEYEIQWTCFFTIFSWL